jgi:hypothetical protein
MLVRYYDTEKYAFISEIKKVFGVSDLHYLHEERKDLMPGYSLTFENESTTNFHKAYYAKQNSGWPELESTYKEFVRNVVIPIVGEDCVYQYMPSVRFHLPDQKAIHKWHYDSDKDHRHPVGEINFQIAITEMNEINATWCESSPGAGDYRPMVMLPGQFLQFDGNKCVHGNKSNTSGKTRVSLDFRVSPRSVYNQNAGNISVSSGKKFVVGEYYREP